MKLTPIERQVLDLSKPFKLYSNNIRISTFEKLNTLERETVQLFRNKVVEMQSQVDITHDYQQIFESHQMALEEEKRAAETKLEIAL